MSTTLKPYSYFMKFMENFFTFRFPNKNNITNQCPYPSFHRSLKPNPRTVLKVKKKKDFTQKSRGIFTLQKNEKFHGNQLWLDMIS